MLLCLPLNSLESSILACMEETDYSHAADYIHWDQSSSLAGIGEPEEGHADHMYWDAAAMAVSVFQTKYQRLGRRGSNILGAVAFVIGAALQV